MRFIITLITSLILLIPASGQGQWEVVNVEIDFIAAAYQDPPNHLLDVQFIDRDKGFFIGAGQLRLHRPIRLLYKTEDGGKTWNLIYENEGVWCSNFDIGSIYFVNESKGFLTGAGNCLTSTDEGYSWSKDTTIGLVSDIFFLNDSIGWACGKHVIFKTINGGENWNEASEIISNFWINSLFFIDDSKGWAVGEAGLITKYNLADGWETLPGVTDLPLKKVFFIDRDHGWIAGGYFNRHDGTRPILMRTVDGGENWTRITLNYLINDFYFETKDHGWAVGMYYDYEEDLGSPKYRVGVILETVNGGLDWGVVKDSLSARLNALHFKDGYGWAVGDEGLILKYTPTITGIKEDKINSGNNPFFQNYPNPFSFNTIISYQLPATSDVELSVYDISGRKVATLVNETQLADLYEVEWNAEGMNSGIYFCELKTGQGRQVMKMSIVR